MSLTKYQLIYLLCIDTPVTCTNNKSLKHGAYTSLYFYLLILHFLYFIARRCPLFNKLAN